MEKLLNSNFYKIFIAVLTIALIILNGININFEVNYFTVIFFSILCLPILFELVEKLKTNLRLKVGKYEADFTNLPLKQQIFTFLNGIIYHHQWTFYETRQGETKLGEAFYILISDLQQNYRAELYKEIRKWLLSENDNDVWFASEIIGYFQINEFKKDLKKKIVIDKPDLSLSNAQLNCLWAFSRFDHYIQLIDFFNNTKSEKNLKWIMYVFYQMSKANQGEPSDFIPILKTLLNRSDNSDIIIKVAKETLEKLENIEKTLHNNMALV